MNKYTDLHNKWNSNTTGSKHRYCKRHCCQASIVKSSDVANCLRLACTHTHTKQKTIIMLTGTRSGYFLRIFSPSARRFSKGCSSLYCHFIVYTVFVPVEKQNISSQLLVFASQMKMASVTMYWCKQQNTSAKKIILNLVSAILQKTTLMSVILSL